MDLIWPVQEHVHIVSSFLSVSTATTLHHRISHLSPTLRDTPREGEMHCNEGQRVCSTAERHWRWIG